MDGSGIWASYDPTSGHTSITLKDGTQVGATREDTNGNLATSSADTLNRNPLVVTNGVTVTYKTPLGKSVSGPQYTLWTTTDSSGSSAVYRVDYQGIDIQTSFCKFECNNFTGSLLVPSKVTLPNATTYQFSWFNNSAGEIQQIVLPTGGSIAYTYGNSCMTGPDQGANPTSDCRRAVLTRTVTQNGNSATWSYAGGTVTDPYGNDEVHTFSYLTVSTYSSTGQVETQLQTYSGSASTGKLLRTVLTDYTGEVGGTSTFHVINVRPIRTTVTLDNGLAKKTETDYETFAATSFTATRMNVTERREYDYGSGSPGPLLRRTDYTYLHAGNQNYISRNIVDRVATSTVYDGSGTQVAQTVNEHDNYSHANQPMQASSAIQHDSSYSTSFVYRGNLTAVQRWLNTNNSFLTTTNQYDDAGNVLSMVDPLGHKTAFDFTDSWANTACAPASQGKAYATKITNALNQVTSHTYFACTGLLGSTTDPNLNATAFQYDSLFRLARVTYPAQVVNGTTLNGVTNYVYTDTPGSLNVEKTKKIDATRTTDEFFYFDGLGRVISHSAANDESTAWDKEDTCYDSVDRKSFVSYPYQAASPTAAQVCSGSGDSFSYDPLNRVTQVTHSDGSFVSNTYTGRATDVVDEGNGTRGVERISQTDALGRLASLCEVTGSTLLGSGGTPGSCGQDISKTGFLTAYSYDTLGNLIGVSQTGLNARSYAYDSLSRLSTDSNPETGTMTYSYDSDGNVFQRIRPAPNQTNPSVKVTTTYAYDALNRPTGKTYSDTTPAVTINYDESASFGVTLTNTIGRKSSEYTGPSTAKLSGGIYSYDSRGHVADNSQCTPQNCATGTFSVAYQYDLIGDELTATNGVGITLTETYNRTGRPTQVTSSLANTNHPGTLISQIHYNAFGSPVSASLGNAIAEAYTYTTRGWVQSLSATLNTTAVYNFSITNPTNGQTGYSGNGNVLLANDSANGSWSYAYDDMNRLVTSGKSGQAFSYVYDRFGNRWQQNVTTGTGPNPSYSFDANNRITGSSVTYDAAGNVTNDGSHTYTYDAENRIVSVGGSSTATYVYDGDGLRVRKTTSALTVDYVYDVENHAITEILSSGVWNRGELYLAGRHLATYRDGTAGTTSFSHTDWLGTERVRTGPTGANQETCTSLPFGDALSCTGSDQSPLHFTGKQRDTETGLDEFPARYYSSTQGRWMSPDWSPEAVAIPYADLHDPRTLNLYAYVGNDPTNHADPDGHANGVLPPPPTCTGSAGNGDVQCSASVPLNQFAAIANSNAAQNQQTPQSLAAQVPSEMKAAIVDALHASNSPTADDKQGGYHEESVKSGRDASGNVVVSPSVPGLYAPPGTNPHTSFTPVNPKTDEKLVTVDVFAHIHPRGGADRKFGQGPSPQDKEFAKGSSAINIVVGAANKKVYFFNSSGVIGKPIKLKEFTGGPQ